MVVWLQLAGPRALLEFVPPKRAEFLAVARDVNSRLAHRPAKSSQSNE